MSTHFEDQPLRAQKRARTQVALVDALVERLAEQPLEAVQISALAKAAGVSPATFFNYFPTKGDLLTHFIQLWSLRVAAIARRIEAASTSPLAAVEALFAHTAAEISPHPNVMLETIAHQARMPADLVLPPIDLVERLLYLPGEPDVMALSDRGLGGLLPPLFTQAVAAGELPATTDVMALTLGASSVFFGVPLVLGRTQPALIGPMYQRQLELLWAGARAMEHTDA